MADPDALRLPTLDAKVDFKLGTFSGRDEDWFIWAMRFEAYTALLGWNDVLEQANDLRLMFLWLAKLMSGSLDRSTRC